MRRHPMVRALDGALDLLAYVYAAGLLVAWVLLPRTADDGAVHRDDPDTAYADEVQ